LLRSAYRCVIVDNAQNLRASQQLVARHHNLMVASDPQHLGTAVPTSAIA
jgi:hypothetical protein